MASTTPCANVCVFCSSSENRLPFTLREKLLDHIGFEQKLKDCQTSKHDAEQQLRAVPQALRVDVLMHLHQVTTNHTKNKDSIISFQPARHLCRESRLFSSHLIS